jgi:hypothetical protein
MESENPTVSLYENFVPPFAEAEMERLHQNIYSSLANLQLSPALADASTYVVCRGNEVISILLFRCENPITLPSIDRARLLY